MNDTKPSAVVADEVDGILYVRGTGGFSKEIPIEGANEMQIFDFKYRNGVLTLRIK